MLLNKLIKTTALLLISLFLFTPTSYSGFGIGSETDGSNSFFLVSFFDLRDRETFVQLTNIESIGGTVHVQIFDVSNNCNENNFFDTYTAADTHVYNMRDIQTNNGNPSGVVLPNNAYGFVSIISVDPVELTFSDFNTLVGNFRILDNNGFEYRSNSVDPQDNGNACCLDPATQPLTFNFNSNNGVILSDVVGITFFIDDEAIAADISNIFYPYDIDIIDLNEVPFSCRNIIFACTDQDNPLLEALLEEAGVASVASFEYGINNAIAHSKGGELLCPGNIISDGQVTLKLAPSGEFELPFFVGFVGLNNGNGRGSLDSFWYQNIYIGFDDEI